MKHQQGAALVIVMALLAGSMTLGLSGMQTALVDERLAGNYRASTLAQMAAESGAVIRHEESASGDSGEECEGLKESVKRSNVNKEAFSEFTLINSLYDGSGIIAGYYYAGCQKDGESLELIVGQVKSDSENSINEFIAVDYYVVNRNNDDGSGSEPDNNGSFGSGGVVAGEGGVRLTGSAQVSGGIVTSGDVEISGGLRCQIQLMRQGPLLPQATGMKMKRKTFGKMLLLTLLRKTL